MAKEMEFNIGEVKRFIFFIVFRSALRPAQIPM
jgi:hypothetical protein